MTQEILTKVLLTSGGVLGALFAIVWVVKMFLYICPPNMILVFSGSSHKNADGSSVGSRVIFGGRGFKKPLVEEANYMDVSLISVDMEVSGAYSKGGIPLTVHAIANIKVSTNPKTVNNAIERFLIQGREEIKRVGKETL
jgi:flotillin